MIDYKPYCWLEFITTSESILHFRVRIPNGTIYLDSSPPRDDFQNHKRTIIYNIVEGTTATERDYQYALNVATNYDPVLEDISIEIKKGDEKKGTSTTTQSEADASGGDDLF